MTETTSESKPKKLHEWYQQFTYRKGVIWTGHELKLVIVGKMNYPFGEIICSHDPIVERGQTQECPVKIAWQDLSWETFEVPDFLPRIEGSSESEWYPNSTTFPVMYYTSNHYGATEDWIVPLVYVDAD